MKIGVLALQGDFIEHIALLRRLGVDAVEVRLPGQLEDLDGLIIPGGESTTIGKLADDFGMVEPLRQFGMETDRDVESVVREVVLRKRSEHVPMLKSKLDEVSGEIDRHLGGTQLASRATDKQDLVPDYPL